MRFSDYSVNRLFSPRIQSNDYSETGYSYLKTVQKVMVRMTKAQFHS